MIDVEENDNKSCQKNIGTSTNLNNILTVKSDSCFHAVYIPTDTENSENTTQDLHIYFDKLEALKNIKKHKSARLKTFKTWDEAEQFARHGFEENNINNINIPAIRITVSEEKSSNFKNLKPQELVAFRKIIESGDLEGVDKLLKTNPKYLISSGDTPAILQEGCRYNAAHIIASKGLNNEKMLKLILDTVSDPVFVGSMYGKESDIERAQILLDLYLNTPDKGLNETPLHFAAKFGMKNVVQLLVSYPECQKNQKNKWKQTPMDIVCSRKGQEDENLVKEIRGLLEEQFYVPVLRAENNILQPTIGEPFSPISPPRLNSDPMSPKVEVAALAGPMSKPKAIEFRRQWKTPPRRNLSPSRKENLNNSFCYLTSPRFRNPGMRLQDTEKGLERVGRDLAEEYHVSWKEYWPFLDSFADLRCTEGLSMLEKFFSDRSLKSISNQNSYGIRPLENFDEKITIDTELDNFVDSMVDIENLVKKLELCSLENDSNDDSDTEYEFFTPPASPEPPVGDRKSDTSDDELVEAEEGNVEFIDGDAPGKTDFAVLNAIPEFIDSEIFPFIYRWKHEVNLATRRNHTGLRLPRRRLQLSPEKDTSS